MNLWTLVPPLTTVTSGAAKMATIGEKDDELLGESGRSQIFVTLYNFPVVRNVEQMANA